MLGMFGRLALSRGRRLLALDLLPRTLGAATATAAAPPLALGLIALTLDRGALALALGEFRFFHQFGVDRLIIVKPIVIEFGPRTGGRSEIGRG